MPEQTEQTALVGWRRQFSTLHRLFQHISTETLEKVTVYLMLLLIWMLPVEMIARMFSNVGVYSPAYGIMGLFIEMTAIAWLGKRIFQPQAFHQSKWLICDAALLAMLGWSVLSTLAAPDPRACFYGDIYRNEGLATYFIYAAVYVSVRHCSRRENFRRIMVCLVAAISLISVFSSLCLSPLKSNLANLLALPDSEIIYRGISGPFANKNHYSYMLGVATMLAGALYITDSSKKLRPICLAGYVVMIHVMILNGSLGGYLAAAIGLGAYLVVACIRKDLQPRMAVLLILLYVAVSYISPGLFGDFSGNLAEDMKEAMESIQDPEGNVTTLTYRLDMWADALTYIGQRPVLGFGPDGSGLLEFPTPGFVYNRPHNEYIQYATYLGIPGLAMYLTALGSLLVRLLCRFRKLSPLCVVIACGVLSYCASAFVGNTMYYTTIYFVAILALLVNESEYTYPAAVEKP